MVQLNAENQPRPTEVGESRLTAMQCVCSRMELGQRVAVLCFIFNSAKFSLYDLLREVDNDLTHWKAWLKGPEGTPCARTAHGKCDQQSC